MLLHCSLQGEMIHLKQLRLMETEFNIFILSNCLQHWQNYSPVFPRKHMCAIDSYPKEMYYIPYSWIMQHHITCSIILKRSKFGEIHTFAPLCAVFLSLQDSFPIYQMGSSLQKIPETDATSSYMYNLHFISEF